LLQQFLVAYQKLPSRRRSDIAAYVATWPYLRTRDDVLLVLIRHELETRPLRWLNRLLKLGVISLSTSQLIELLRNVYADRVDLKQRPAWREYAVFGISATRLKLRHAKDCLHLGEKLAGGWVVEQRYAEGGLGIVYLGRHAENGTRVAIKASRVIDPENQATFARRINDEAGLLERLTISGVPRIKKRLQVRGQPILIMDWINGKPLRNLRGTLAIRDALKLFKRVAEIVNNLHRAEYVHADLKSENILVTSRGTPYVIDFNLSRRANPVGQPEGFQGGTLGWMSPEANVGVAADVDLRQDLYALGALLFEMTTGQPLIQATSRSDDLIKSILLGGVHQPEFPENVPAVIQELCRNLISRQTLKRYETAAEVVKVCQDLLEQVTWTTLPQPQPKKTLSAWRLGMAFGRMTVRARHIENLLPLVASGSPEESIPSALLSGMEHVAGVALAYEEVAVLAKLLILPFQPWPEDGMFMSLVYRAQKLKIKELGDFPQATERLKVWCRTSLETWQETLQKQDPRSFAAFCTSLQTRFVPYSFDAAKRWLKCANACGYPLPVVERFARACRRSKNINDWKPLVDDLDYRVIKMLRWPKTALK